VSAQLVQKPAESWQLLQAGLQDRQKRTPASTETNWLGRLQATQALLAASANPSTQDLQESADPEQVRQRALELSQGLQEAGLGVNSRKTPGWVQSTQTCELC